MAAIADPGGRGGPPPAEDGGAPSSVGGDAGSSSSGGGFDAAEFDVGTVRWADLYAAYFGPDGAASCTAQSLCHGSPAQLGAATSGYVCGTSSTSCWQGLSALINQGATGPGLTGSFLYSVLRKYDGTGTMPYKSTYEFQAEDLARINAWIVAGTPDD